MTLMRHLFNGDRSYFQILTKEWQIYFKSACITGREQNKEQIDAFENEHLNFAFSVGGLTNKIIFFI